MQLFDHEVKLFSTALQNAKTILITSTEGADGDSVGSQLAILDILNQYNSQLKIDILNETPCPLMYHYLPTHASIKDKTHLNDVIYDIAIVTDGGAERTGAIRNLFENAKCKILVDHHKEGSKMKYNISFWDPNASSTCEIIYYIATHPLINCKLNSHIASCLYTGITFDTGSFMHSITRSETHKVASKLLETQLHFSQIAYSIFRKKRFVAQKLLALVLTNLQFETKNGIAYSWYSKKDMIAVGATSDDTEGLITQIDCISDARVSILFYDNDEGTVKISFRSKENIDVATFAKTLNPDGGGHARASGCKILGTISSVREDVVARLQNYLA